MVGNYLCANELYRNEGGGTFTPITNTPITSGSAYTYAVAWGDMDGDGDLVRRWERSGGFVVCARVPVRSAPRARELGRALAARRT